MRKLKSAMLIRGLLTLLLTSPVCAQTWTDATFVSTRTVNEWCRHCPDWNRTRYSFRLADGTTYVAETHVNLNLTLHASAKIRFEQPAKIGGKLHVLDESGKEHALKIVEKIAP